MEMKKYGKWKTKAWEIAEVGFLLVEGNEAFLRIETLCLALSDSPTHVEKFFFDFTFSNEIFYALANFIFVVENRNEEWQFF